MANFIFRGLTFGSKSFIFRFTYHKSQGQYGAYFFRFLGPLVAIFAILSVLLSVMQVSLAALEAMDNSNLQTWRSLAKVSNEFAIFVLFSVGLSLVFTLCSVLNYAVSRGNLCVQRLVLQKKTFQTRCTGNRTIESRLQIRCLDFTMMSVEEKLVIILVLFIYLTLAVASPLLLCVLPMWVIWTVNIQQGKLVIGDI